MFVPYADFPEGHKLNSIQIFPELFKKVDFRDFSTALIPHSRFWDFAASELFLHAAPFQNNSMTSLIMLLSAIERAVAADHKPLDWHLTSKAFKAKAKAAKSGEEAYKLLEKEVAAHSRVYGSRSSIVKFYTDNLSDKQKLQLINGITFAHKFKKRRRSSDTIVTLYTPVREPQPILRADDTKALNKELSRRIKAVIYNIRNGFVHKAVSNPFGNEEYLKQNVVYHHETIVEGEPKEAWVITMTFDRLYELTLAAFQKFWLKEYERAASVTPR